MSANFYHAHAFKLIRISFNYIDLLMILGIFLLVGPLYLSFNYHVTQRILPDELVWLGIILNIFDGTTPFNLFGFSWQNYPIAGFVVMGWIAKLFGSVDFLTMRLANASVGVFIILPAYIFFRLYFNRFYTFWATLMLVSNPALIALSRYIGFLNYVVLLFIIIHFFLILCIKQKSKFLAFWAGIFLGLSFYIYPVARLMFFAWFFSFLVWLFKEREQLNIKKELAIFCVILWGFTAMAGPIILNTWRSPIVDTYMENFLIYQEGRQNQMVWFGMPSIRDGILLNITNGIKMFNFPIEDQYNFFRLKERGIIDPVSGVLLWIGFLAVFLKRRKEIENYLMLYSFLFLWFIFIFIINLTPSFPRILILLPLLIYFITQGLRMAYCGLISIKFVRKGLRKIYLKSFLSLFAAGIIFVNIAAYYTFVWNDLETGGNDYGKVYRYLDHLKQRKNLKIYYIGHIENEPPQQGDLFYDNWSMWYKHLATDPNVYKQLKIDEVLSYSNLFKKPFSLVMTGHYWDILKPSLEKKFPELKKRVLLDEYRIIALESF